MRILIKEDKMSTIELRKGKQIHFERGFKITVSANPKKAIRQLTHLELGSVNPKRQEAARTVAGRVLEASGIEDPRR